jgi:hypothetical protein
MTDDGHRDVDLCPALAAVLKAYVGDRTPVFASATEAEFSLTTNLLRRELHPALEKLKQPKAGFHAFAGTA